MLEPKAAIIVRIAQQDAARRRKDLKPVQSVANEGLAYALPLTLWPNRDRSKTIPITFDVIDGDG